MTSRFLKNGYWARGGGGTLAPQLPRAIRVGPNQGGQYFGVFGRAASGGASRSRRAPLAVSQSPLDHHSIYVFLEISRRSGSIQKKKLVDPA